MFQDDIAKLSFSYPYSFFIPFVPNRSGLFSVPMLKETFSKVVLNSIWYVFVNWSYGQINSFSIEKGSMMPQPRCK